MTRINTNVSSINAQKSLAQSNASLQEALTRLSTGLRINSGKDDPAGLIASESLRADITATKAGITNSERANQMIATADSALGQVSSLLNDIRGLVTEAANNAAMSDDQIAANQLQIDSSLAAINRIAQTTSFQGNKLLDGSLGFLYEGGTNYSYVRNLAINQANMGTASTLAVTATVSQAATQAQIDIENVPTATDPVNATGSITLTNIQAVSSGTFTIDTTPDPDNTITVTAEDGEAYDGAAGNMQIQFVLDDDTADGVATASINAEGTLMTVKVGWDDGAGTCSTTWETIGDAIVDPTVGDDVFAVTIVDDTAVFDTAMDGDSFFLTDGRDAGDTVIQITADSAGEAMNGKTVSFSESADVDAGSVDASVDDDGNITILVNDSSDVTHAAIAAAIDALTGYSAEIISSSGDTTYAGGTDTSDDQDLANGADATGGLDTAVTFSLGGKEGTEVFSFSVGASISQMQTAIEALSDSTGVTASISGTTLELKSIAYGSSAFVDVRVISEDAGGTLRASVGQGNRDAGDDIEGRINGIEATGSASTLRVSNSRMDIAMEVATGFTGAITFDITGGGALFQLGPEVVSNQQSRVGIGSLSTAELGGSAGKLYELQSGGEKSLTGDIIGAAAVLDDVISQVTTLRGRLGAFQKTTLETNINTLNDTLEALTEAESSIRDADFASESANLTRAQILVSSGVSVLATANQNPQNVLQLLR